MPTLELFETDFPHEPQLLDSVVYDCENEFVVITMLKNINKIKVEYFFIYGLV